MKLLLILITSILVSFSANSTTGQDMIITLSDTLYGEVQLNLNENLIRVSNGKHHQMLTASQVKWITKSSQQFCVASFGDNSKYLIFEVLSIGAKPLIYREGVKFNPYDEHSFPPFFVLENRSAFSVQSKKEMLSFFGQSHKKVREYARTNGLSFTRKEDLLRIFDYYNQSD